MDNPGHLFADLGQHLGMRRSISNRWVSIPDSSVAAESKEVIVNGNSVSFYLNLGLRLQ
jgi:hypothetical protein